MAKATQGKRTASKKALKRAPVGRKALTAKSRGAFPGGATKTRAEVERVAPRMTRAGVRS